MFGQEPTTPWGQGGSIGTKCDTNKQCLEPYVCCGNAPEFRVCLAAGQCMEQYTPRPAPMSVGTKAALVGVVAIAGYLVYRVVK